MNPTINLATYDSPVGRLLIACSDAGLVGLSYMRDDNGAVVNGAAANGTATDLTRAFHTKYGTAPANHAIAPDQLSAQPSPMTEHVKQQLDRYFSGQLQRWDLKLDWQLSHGFRQSALRQAWEIPYGATRSYGELAALAGNPKAARAVGTAMAQNPIAIVVPCHRVVRSGGEIGNYGGGSNAKRWLLDMETAGA